MEEIDEKAKTKAMLAGVPRSDAWGAKATACAKEAAAVRPRRALLARQMRAFTMIRI